VPQHDSFGQSGDEYKLPVPANIPDATTDPSQIRVLPVVDPTAKPEKAGQAPATAGENSPSDQNQAAQNPSEQSPSEPSPSEQPPSEPGQSGQAPAGENPIKDPATTVVADVPANSGGTNGTVAPAVKAPNAVPSQAVTPQPRPLAPPVRKSAPPHDLSTLSSTGIPSSLKSQMASTTPEASGNKPPEAAMSSIEPVTLPEAAVRGLLAQPIDPVYPEAAKASGQRGSVVLQVLIGRDGAVQDAKFLQGSLVFARAAIDAVKQWHFKPYSMNGRAVSVQSVITLKFQPPA
jgi:protein TonB